MGISPVIWKLYLESILGVFKIGDNIDFDELFSNFYFAISYLHRSCRHIGKLSLKSILLRITPFRFTL